MHRPRSSCPAPAWPRGQSLPSLRSPSYSAGAGRKSTGSTFDAISGSALRAHRVPLAPAAEQRRIVAEIERQFTRLDVAVAALCRAKANLKRYRASVLSTACTGALVPSSGEWLSSTVGEVASVGTGATPKRGSERYWNNGHVPWVTSAVVNEPFVDEPTEFVTELAVRETNLTVYGPGTLLLAMYGEGKTRGMVSELRILATTNQALAAVMVGKDSPVHSSYLKIALMARYAETRRLSWGGVQPNLNLGLVRSISIHHPKDLAEQLRIVGEVESRLSVLTRLAQVVDANLKRAERLRQSILKRAFEGRLVPQDPADEPASVLLGRLPQNKPETAGNRRRARGQ